MTHIANCIRSFVPAKDGVYIPIQTPPASSSYFNYSTKSSSRRSKRFSARTSLGLAMSVSPIELSETKPEPVNSLRLDPSSPLAGRLPTKYQLFPRKAQQQSVIMEPIVPSIQHRSPSSLSDHSIPSRGGLWIRGSSLARRRKVSVPELRQQAELQSSKPIIDSRTFSRKAGVPIDSR
jgi:hypothetical protein